MTKRDEAKDKIILTDLVNNGAFADDPLLCTDTPTSQNASNIIIKSACHSDTCLDGHDNKF